MKLDLSKSLDVTRFQTYGRQLLHDKKKVELKVVKSKKTINQNSYAHVVFGLFGSEFGYNIEEVKFMIKSALKLGYIKNNTWFYKSVADMDTGELSQMIDYARDIAAQQGCYIPTSEEYLNNQFEVDREIERNSRYL